MSESVHEPAIRAHHSAESFERTLIAAYAVILGITTTFMPKTYIPDRWMIAGWVCFLIGFALALVSHFLGQAHCRRTRVAAHAASSVCLVLGLVATVVFVSEGDDGGGEDTYAGSIILREVLEQAELARRPV